MRLHAFLRENTVVKVESIDETQYAEEAIGYQLIIDVQDLLIPPSAGWLLSGNHLVPSAGQAPSLKDQIKAKIAHYRSLAPSLLEDLYAENTLLGITVEQSDALFDEYSDVILRLQQGAFPSALYRLQGKQPTGFVTQQMLDNWISKIQAHL